MHLKHTLFPFWRGSHFHSCTPPPKKKLRKKYQVQFVFSIYSSEHDQTPRGKLLIDNWGFSCSLSGAISCAELHFSFRITNCQGCLLDCFGGRGGCCCTAADAFLSMTAGGSTDHSTMASSVHMDHVCLHGHTMEDGPQHRFLVASWTTDLIKASSCSINSLSIVIKHNDLIQESI